jgi:prevent-host-death family protein
MASVSIRDLRNHGGDIVDRVASGESLTVTRDGKPVAELRPVRAGRLSAAVLVDLWRRLPDVDPVALRDDVDAILDQGL